MKITRRLFLRNTAVAGAAVAVAAPVAASEPVLTRREQAVWHLRELQRLLIEDGSKVAVVQAIGTYSSTDCRMIAIHQSGRLMCDENMLAEGCEI